MTESQRRIAEQQRKSGINKLWDALTPLKHVGSFMNCGAHPDDERSHILAYLARNQGVQIQYSTSTRGKGGQNAIGTEAGDDLGVFRTEELEAAASEIPMSIHYYSARFGDEIDDFGFSTDPREAEEKWGFMRIRERLVRMIRQLKPDIISPTFLDTEGQHGHHRAITRATLDAYDMAADPNIFPEQISQEGLKPWRVKKLYLSASTGRGSVYDDRDPPPEPTVSIPVGQYDHINGATYRQIGEWSRARHLTQGMGRWRESYPEDAHLHRLRSEIDIPQMENDIFDGMPKTFAELAETVDGQLAIILSKAGQNIQDAIAAFPNKQVILEHLTAFGENLTEAISLTNSSSDDIIHNIGHRLNTKLKQLGVAYYEASGVVATLNWDSNFVSPGQRIKGTLSIYNASDNDFSGSDFEIIGVNGDLVLSRSISLDPWEYQEMEIEISVPDDADYHHPLAMNYDPIIGNETYFGRLSINANVFFGFGGYVIEKTILPANPLLVVPPVNLSWEASGLFYNKQNDGAPIEAMLSVEKYTEISSDVEIGLVAPAGWTVMPPNYKIPAGTLPGSSKYNFVISGPTNSDRLTMSPYAICDGKRIEQNVLMMDYEHIRNTCKVVPNTLSIQPIDLQIPKRLKIGYVDRGSDRVYFWMQRFGLDVAMLSVDDLKTQDLSLYDTIVIGIRAFAADLTATSPFLREYVENGGNLVTQYNRTDDDWNNETTPPRPITIGSPSFRWRITDPDATVNYLIPEHHLLNAPNKLNDDDWANWHQERGLYFAAEASNEYEFLLSMADPGKDPLKGALISGKIGNGWHHHCSLILHHQLEQQVPGAARLLANLITPPDWK